MVKIFSFNNLSFTKNKCICLNGVLVTFSIVYFAVSVQIVGDVFAPALLCFVNLSFSSWSIGTSLCCFVSKGAGEGVERCDVYSVPSPFISSHRHVAFISQVTCHFIYVVGGKNNWTSAAVLWMWAVAVRKAVQTCSCRRLIEAKVLGILVSWQCGACLYWYLAAGGTVNSHCCLLLLHWPWTHECEGKKPGNLWQCWDDGIGIICLLPSKQRAFSWVCRLEGIQTHAVSAVRKIRDYPVGMAIWASHLFAEKAAVDVSH